MPRAEAGSLKAISNQQKSKGLQRLRWYCQVCERQMRDENGFKCHVQSEAHVRQMLIVGENSGRHIKNYSSQFQRDFLQLLRTSHGEKAVGLNWFYQSYIGNKEHVHMNATRWKSLTEFAKFVGREGICRVEETDKGLTIAWIDNSPEKLRRQEALRKRERQDRGDEEREQRAILDMVHRANRERGASLEKDELEVDRGLQRNDGEKIVLSFGKKSDGPEPVQTATPPDDSPKEITPEKVEEKDVSRESPELSTQEPPAEPTATSTPSIPTPSAVKPISLAPSSTVKPIKNVFAAAKKKSNPLAGKISSAASVSSQQSNAPGRPMSEAERIMRAELERKRRFEESGNSMGRDKRVRW